MKHYVDDARSGMNLSSIENIGVNEIAIMKGYYYETVFYDHKERRVIHTEMGRKNTVLRKLKNFSMDMAKPYILVVTKYFSGSRIVFDHFHVIKGMNEAVGRESRAEGSKQ